MLQGGSFCHYMRLLRPESNVWIGRWTCTYNSSCSCYRAAEHSGRNGPLLLDTRLAWNENGMAFLWTCPARTDGSAASFQSIWGNGLHLLQKLEQLNVCVCKTLGPHINIGSWAFAQGLSNVTLEEVSSCNPVALFLGTTSVTSSVFTVNLVILKIVCILFSEDHSTIGVAHMSRRYFCFVPVLDMDTVIQF